VVGETSKHPEPGYYSMNTVNRKIARIGGNRFGAQAGKE
jgi:hypothetical protein